jgi:CheY-like chemotaxis protein
MARILVVDDEDDVAGLMSEVLKDAGYEVETVPSGLLCLKKLREKTYDLVLMDMFMPGMSGRETFERIIQDDKLKSVKVAFLTVAKLGIDARLELMKVGAVAYLNKPIRNEVLVKKVKELLVK